MEVVESQLREKMISSSTMGHSVMLAEVDSLSKLAVKPSPSVSPVRLEDDNDDDAAFFVGDLAGMEQGLREQFKLMGETIGLDRHSQKIALNHLKETLTLRSKSEDVSFRDQVLTSKVSPTKRDKDGWNALHKAAFTADEDLARFCLDKCVKTSARNSIGQTPLHIAVMMESIEIIRILLKSGADIKAEDQLGHTPFFGAPEELLKELELSEKPKTADSEYELDLADLEYEELLGRGAFALVYHGYWRGCEVAIKEVDWEKAQMTEQKMTEFFREVGILAKMRHPNLVLFMGAYTRSRPLRMVTEFCRGGTLHGLLHDKKNIFISFEQKLDILIDIICGLMFIHTSKPVILHGDMKSNNILLTNSVSGPTSQICCKIADFGIAVTIGGQKKENSMPGAQGTFCWMAPEILRSSEIVTEAADIYSFAVVMFEVLTRMPPFEALVAEMPTPFAIASRVCDEGERPDLALVPSDPSGRSDLLVEWIKRGWDGAPQNRPRAAELLKSFRKIKSAVKVTPLAASEVL